MSKPEKIGQDILGGTPPSRMSMKKRKALEEKLKEEIAKREEARRRAEEDLEKLPKLGIPGEVPHEITPEERAEIVERLQKEARELGLEGKEKEVFVREHLRSKPKKSKKSLVDAFLNIEEM